MRPKGVPYVTPRSQYYLHNPMNDYDIILIFLEIESDN